MKLISRSLLILVMLSPLLAGCGKTVIPSALPTAIGTLEEVVPIAMTPTKCILATATPAWIPVETTLKATLTIENLVIQVDTDSVTLTLVRPANPEFDAFLETSWREIMLRSPELVLEVGLEEIYGVQEARLDDISDEYRRETYQVIARVLDELHSYERASLSPSQQLSYNVYAWYLEDHLTGREFMYYDYPATYFPSTAVHEQIILFFTDIHPLTNMQDVRDYLTRLGLVQTKIDQLIDGIERRTAAGIIPPRFASQWALYGSLGSLPYTNPRQTPFYTNLADKLSDLPGLNQPERESLLAEAEAIIRASVLPAYQELAQVVAHLSAIGSEQDGLWQFPGGDAYYEYLLHHHTTTRLSAAEIHQLGLQELEKIHSQMRVAFDALGYPQDESLVQLFNRAARDGGHVSGNQVLETYEELISQAEARLDQAFDLRPRARVIVVADQYGGFYIPGSIDGSRSGAFYAQVGGAGEDYYSMPTLAYHEAIPGHHLQIALAQELDLPSFRNGVIFTAYAEGWALYAEQLAWELGWYQGDPYGDLGRLQAQAFRAARLVVDTGLHADGWTFDQAQLFFTENTGYEVGDSVNPQHQIARYIVMPGQATAYYVGFLKILELRQRIQSALGDQFDLKAFHRLILADGSLPLEILDQLVGAP